MFRPELLRILGITDSTMYAWLEAGILVRPISLGPNRSNGNARRNAWIREEVYQWIRDQAAKSRAPAKPARGASQPA
ncbi:AlpA family transcriptional regulator [Pseudomonas sp. P1.8]|uniref:helix-turn-helix transcriptional regulator n=1 Tax=Pseudomonas sp. P1.8 TaxID=1699310 RepID=UPI0012E1B190|nr:hypothetical protein [Pseudomonas sp. P1.8]